LEDGRKLAFLLVRRAVDRRLPICESVPALIGLALARANKAKSMEPAPKVASPKEKFDTLFGLLKDYYAGLLDFEFKHATVLTLLLGWGLVSNEARSFLHSHRAIAWCGCVALILYLVFYAMWVLHFYRRSRLAYSQLAELEYMPSEYFEMRRIQPFTVVSFIALHCAVVIVICAVLLFAEATPTHG